MIGTPNCVDEPGTKHGSGENYMIPTGFTCLIPRSTIKELVGCERWYCWHHIRNIMCDRGIALINKTVSVIPLVGKHGEQVQASDTDPFGTL